MALRIRAPTSACCQKSGMPRIGSTRLIVTSRIGADGRTPDGAAAAEDGDATDHDRRDGLELDASAGARAHAAVARGEDDTGETGQGAAEHERGDHSAADAQAVEDGRVGV